MNLYSYKTSKLYKVRTLYMLMGLKREWKECDTHTTENIKHYKIHIRDSKHMVYFTCTAANLHESSCDSCLAWAMFLPIHLLMIYRKRDTETKWWRERRKKIPANLKMIPLCAWASSYWSSSCIPYGASQRLRTIQKESGGSEADSNNPTAPHSTKTHTWGALLGAGG